MNAIKQVGQKIQQTANQGLHTIQVAQNQIIDQTSDIAKLKFEQLQQMKLQVNTRLKDIKKLVKTDFSHLSQSFKDQIIKEKEKINEWVRYRIEVQIIKMFYESKVKVKTALKDPDMFDSLKDIIDDVVDELWPELEEEILYMLRMSLYKPYVDLSPAKPWLICCPCDTFRHWFNYTSQPYDMSIWKRIKTISFWVIFFLEICPVYGIQSFFFVLIFLMMDKSDEYQLVKFILSFKQLQFITQGCINAMLGYFQLLVCETLLNEAHVSSSNCLKNGPGVQIQLETDIVSYLCQLLLIWVSFFMIPFAKTNGRPSFKYIKRQESGVKQESSFCCFLEINMERGGRLGYFMMWDLASFIVSVGFYIFLYFYLEQRNYVDFQYQIKSIIFFVKVLYGLLSFPFLIFLIPQIQSILTKSRPTGYNKKGICRPMDQRIQENYLNDNEDYLNLNQIDIQDLVDGFQRSSDDIKSDNNV